MRAADARHAACTQAAVAPSRKLSEPSVLLGAERQTREEDVLKELHVLKTIDQCVRRCVRGRRRRSVLLAAAASFLGLR